MLTNDPKNRFSRLSLLVGVAGVVVGIGAGFVVGIQPLLPIALLVVVAAVVFFFSSFEQAVFGLLIVRSSLDIFLAQQIPAAHGMAINGLTLLYALVMLLTRRPVQTDGFWWLFASWILLQGLWVVLLPLGGLGFDSSFLMVGVREWIRRFSWLMVYLLIMQLKNRIHPEKLISLLLLSLIVPLTVALMQTLLPTALLPPLLARDMVDGRVSGTLGFPNTLGIYLSLLIGLVWWKLSLSQRRWPWILLLTLIAFVYVNTGYLTGLATLAIIIIVVNASKINPIQIIGAVILCLLFLAFFANTEIGQHRLGELTRTPLLNPDIDLWRAILLAQGGDSSFNWRLAHWYFLVQSWKEAPIFGHGLSTGMYLSPLRSGDGGSYTPHSDYIRFLVEQGIVGLGLFLGFLGAQALYLVRIIWRAPRESSEQLLCIILLAVLLSTIVGMFTNNVLDCGAFFFYWWISFAVAGWGTQNFTSEPQSITSE
jgi:O-antigen ligase